MDPIAVIYLSLSQLALKSSFATLMVFLKLNEINYFHILQTLHRVRGSPISPHVYNQLSSFVLQMN